MPLLSWSTWELNILETCDFLWSDIWNVSYIELQIWNQESYDHRSYERNLSNWAFSWVLIELIRTHKWLAPNVSGFIAQLVRVSHQRREVTGLNPVEVLTFSGF